MLFICPQPPGRPSGGAVLLPLVCRPLVCTAAPMRPPQLFSEQGRTKLGIAAAQGDIEQLDAAVVEGQSPHAPDAFWHETPLHLAATFGHLKVVKALIKEYEAPVDPLNWEGWSPLCCALVNGHIEVAKYLIESGANPNHKTKAGNNSVLHLAGWHGTSCSVEWLLQLGMEVGTENGYGLKPFQMAPPGQARRLLQPLGAASQAPAKVTARSSKS